MDHCLCFVAFWSYIEAFDLCLLITLGIIKLFLATCCRQTHKLLFNTSQVINCELYHGEHKLLFNEMVMIISAWY